MHRCTGHISRSFVFILGSGHDYISEILLKVALNTINQIKSNQIIIGIKYKMYNITLRPDFINVGV